jgi:hypothetical protein
MFSTKTRTTIVALIASLSFAGATIAPAVSQATYKINGGKKASQECEMLTEWINQDIQNMEKYRAEGNQEMVNYYRGIIADEFNEGYAAGCAFASVTHAPVSAPVSVASKPVSAKL